MNLTKTFKTLKNPIFAKLYFAQAISLLGDAITWVGVALLAFEFGGDNSARILATALTLRVVAFILIGSYAGVLADRIDRKKIMIVTHLARMVIVGFLPFVSQEWQLYVLIFSLNIFNAFFTPAYKAAIPASLPDKEDYGDAVTLSNATWQLLGVLGPGLAGGLAVFMGVRDIFFFDAASFILALLFVLSIKSSLAVAPADKQEPLSGNILAETWKGTQLLFSKPNIRFAVLIELVAAVAGAHILVNTVGHVKGTLHLDSEHYGWVMTAFGIGATIAALMVNSIDKTPAKHFLLITGGALICVAITGANFVGYPLLMGLWVAAGIGQSFAEMPSQILIAENIPLAQQGRAYGAHFAWSHLWWAFGYPIAGFVGSYFIKDDFLIGGIISGCLLLAIISYWTFNRKKQPEQLISVTTRL